jgi:hypothetical protein
LGIAPCLPVFEAFGRLVGEVTITPVLKFFLERCCLGKENRNSKVKAMIDGKLFFLSYFNTT